MQRLAGVRLSIALRVRSLRGERRRRMVMVVWQCLEVLLLLLLLLLR